MRIYSIEVSAVTDTQKMWDSIQELKNTDLLVLKNNTPLTPDSTFVLLYAMIFKRPIIIYDLPQFTESVYPLLKGAILKRLNKMLLANIEQLDPVDSERLLKEAANTSTNYSLTRHETILIRSYALSYLRARPFVNLAPYPESTIPSQFQLSSS